MQRVCQKALKLIHGFGKQRLEAHCKKMLIIILIYYRVNYSEPDR